MLPYIWCSIEIVSSLGASGSKAPRERARASQSRTKWEEMDLRETRVLLRALGHAVTDLS